MFCFSENTEHFVYISWYPCPFSQYGVAKDLLLPVLQLLPDLMQPQDAHPDWQQLYAQYAYQTCRLHASWEILLGFKQRSSNLLTEMAHAMIEEWMQTYYDDAAELFNARHIVLLETSALYKELQKMNLQTIPPMFTSRYD